jgi:hypothetical protein
MLTHFEKCHKYVFDLNMFAASTFIITREDVGWTGAINGRPVNIKSGDLGLVCSKTGCLYYVIPKWCREVE